MDVEDLPVRTLRRFVSSRETPFDQDTVMSALVRRNPPLDQPWIRLYKAVSEFLQPLTWCE